MPDIKHPPLLFWPFHLQHESHICGQSLVITPRRLSCAKYKRFHAASVAQTA
jgi:hypothetical protein